jgi:hypothetical protein
MEEPRNGATGMRTCLPHTVRVRLSDWSADRWQLRRLRRLERSSTVSSTEGNYQSNASRNYLK